MELSHSKSDSFKIFDKIATKYDFINLGAIIRFARSLEKTLI